MRRKYFMPEDILTIREYYAHGYSLQFLADRFKTSRQTISDIVHWRTYKRVKQPSEPLPVIPEKAGDAFMPAGAPGTRGRMLYAR